MEIAYCWVDAKEAIQHAICGSLFLSPLQRDSVTWKFPTNRQFTAKSAWDVIGKKKGSRVEWFKLIGGPLHIPRHSFICWLTILDRLTTKKRQIKMGRVVDPVCV